MTRSTIIRAIFLACIVAYPLIVFFGLQHLPPGVFAIALVVLLGMRYGVLLPSERPIYLPVLFIYLAYAITAALSQSATMLLYYPAIVNLTMSGVFLFSLRQGDPLLLRIVRARGSEISPQGPVYLYRLTGIWAAFFIVNALISIWTSTQSIEVWTLYNGFLSYCLVGALIGLEIVFRERIKQRMGVEKAFKFPNILSRVNNGDTQRFELDISEELIWFSGHFPGYPVLPGVVQLRWAVEMSQQHFGFRAGPSEVMRLKFKSIIVPPRAVELSLTRLSPTATQFAFTGQGREYSQGKLIFDEVGQ